VEVSAFFQNANAFAGNINSLFMYFCDSNEIVQMEQQEKQQHQRAGINCMLMII